MHQDNEIKIFLGSSITELKDERKDISADISADLCKLFERDNIFINFYKCENDHSGNTGEPDQDRIDRQLQECDISLFLFKKKAGKDTIHEYEVARELQKKKKSEKDKIHEIKVYTINSVENERTDELKSFLNRIYSEGVYHEDCKDVSETKYRFALCLLDYLGIQCQSKTFGVSKSEITGDSPLAQYEKAKQQLKLCQTRLHNEIDNILSQIEQTKTSPTESVTAKVMQVICLYNQADTWAVKSDYNQLKHVALLHDYVNYLYEFGLYNEAKDVCLRLIELSEKTNGKNHSNTAQSYNTLGLIFRKQGLFKVALKSCKKALTIMESQKGKEHFDTARIYCSLGMIY